MMLCKGIIESSDENYEIGINEGLGDFLEESYDIKDEINTQSSF